MRSLSMRRIALLAAWTVAAFTCDGTYKVRTCCKNQMVHIDKYNSDFLAYVCETLCTTMTVDADILFRRLRFLRFPHS